VPTGRRVQRVTLELDQGGWEFASARRWRSCRRRTSARTAAGATLVFAPQGTAGDQLRPKQRNLAAETTQFFAEAANLYVPVRGS